MKKNKLLLGLTTSLASLSLVAPISAIATSCSCNTKKEETKEGSDFVLIKTEKGYCIDSLSAQDRTKITNIVVPETINGTKVVEISKGAFKGCVNLQSITLPFIGHTPTSTGTNGFFGYVFGDEMYEGCGAYTWQEYSLSDEYDDPSSDYAQFAIPSTLKKVTITNAQSIPAGAFSNCKFLNSIEINNHSNAAEIKEISNYAFYNCATLRNFTMPTNLEVIGRKAFQRCYNLKAVNLPSTVKQIKHNAFSNCISAVQANVPASVTKMGTLVFENFISGLIMVEAETEPATWDQNWTSETGSVVYGYSSGGIYYTDTAIVAVCGKDDNKYGFIVQWLGGIPADGKVTIPGTATCGSKTYPIKKLGPNVFLDEEQLKEVVISKNVKVISANAFQGCKNLTSVTFGDDLEIIGPEAFVGCDSLETVDFNNVKTIERYAFYNDMGLKTINLRNVETIGESAFEYCEWLSPLRTKNAEGETVYNPLIIPSSVQTIGARAFKDTCRHKTDEQQEYGDLEFEQRTEKIEIGESAFENFGVRTTTTDYPSYLRMSVEFNNMPIDKFENAVFKNAYVYAIYNFPQSITAIGDEAFRNTLITYTHKTDGTLDQRELIIPPSVTSIGKYAFYNNYYINFVLEEQGKTSSLKSIGNNAFSSCYFAGTTSGGVEQYKGFKTLNIPNSVETIGTSAFSSCSALEDVTLPTNANFTRLENSIFSGCTNFGKNTSEASPFIVPSTVTYLGSSAFSACRQLKAVKIEGEITTIGSSCFANCESIDNGNNGSATLVFSDNLDHVTSFGSSVYLGCKAMKYAPFPKANNDKITAIPQTCFADCTTLDNFDVLSPIVTIGKEAFRNCTSMTKVTMSAVKTINQSVFIGCSNLTEIEGLNAVTTIGENAFSGCTSLGKNGNDFVLPSGISQAWTTGSAKGMGTTPFVGWTSAQTIYFTKDNIEEYLDKGEIKLRWGWILTPDNVASPTAYKCTASGTSQYIFKFKQ